MLRLTKTNSKLTYYPPHKVDFFRQRMNEMNSKFKKSESGALYRVVAVH